MHMKHFLTIATFIITPAILANTWFVSPNGLDEASGNSPNAALRSISRALDLAAPGDTVSLLPGTYFGTNTLEDLHGQPDMPIVIKSHAFDPLNFAVIDGQSPPTLNGNHEGFVMRNCSWINLEHLIFRNCWTHVVQIFDSPYISVRGCHFSTGKRIIHAVGHATHHTLVEFCHVTHPEGVWKGWSWESLHHGEVSYYNGALLHPNKSGGGHIMRYNTLVNVFNAFRTRPVSIAEDGNTEIYGNRMINIRDNEFEPESFAWNMHYYHNDHVNVHKMYSIDGVKGGNIYIYGNTYTQTTDPWALEEVSGIFKYKNGPITAPCYAFNNSYYTEAKVLRLGESTNHHLKHFNNAYYFFQGVDNFRLSAWQPGFEFDYDCQNQQWPENIVAHGQERHGLALTDPGFVDGLGGDFTLMKGSACRDAGKVLQLPEFDWSQSYTGSAPDIGAFDGENRVDGPPFRFLPSPDGAYYEERPRVSKIRGDGRSLFVYFSTAIDPATLQQQFLSVIDGEKNISISGVAFLENNFGIEILLAEDIRDDRLRLQWLKKPKGKNGFELTNWGAFIPPNSLRKDFPDLGVIPIPAHARNNIPDFEGVRLQIDPAQDDVPMTFRIIFDKIPPLKYINHIAIYSPLLGELTFVYEPKWVNKELHFQHPEVPLEPGTYLARTRIGKRIIETEFQVE